MDSQQTDNARQPVITPLKLLLGLFLLVPVLSYALPPEFTATYTAETYGTTVAQATYKLEHKNNGITFTQHSIPVGLAKYFTDEAIDETSILSLHKDQLLLDEYHYIQKDSKKNRDIHLKIQWHDTTENNISGNISGIASGKPVQLETNTPVWDTLSFQIPLMTNTSEKTTSQELAILVKGDLTRYLFITHGTEEVTIGNNVFKTMKVERKDDDKNKPLFFWIAPSLHNIPVKIEKWKKGKPHITMLLNSATLPSGKKLQFKTEEDFGDL